MRALSTSENLNLASKLGRLDFLIQSKSMTILIDRNRIESNQGNKINTNQFGSVNVNINRFDRLVFADTDADQF